MSILQQEPVELRFGQRIRPFGVERILRREHHERPRQQQGLALQADLMLLHDLEERALRLRRRAVDLVGQQDVREHRPAHHPHRMRLRDRARRAR